MMNAQSPNPYAPPQVEDDGRAPGPITANAWVEGKDLVTLIHGVELPERCIKCNAPTPGSRMKKTFYWHTPLLFLLIFVNLLIFIIFAVIVRKKAALTLSLCARHLKRRSKIRRIGAGILVFGLLLGIAIRGPAGVTVAVLSILTGIITMIMASRTLVPRKIDKMQARFRGIHPDFLDELQAEAAK